MLPIGLGYGKVLQSEQWVADVRYEVEVQRVRGQVRYCGTLALLRGSLITRLATEHLVLVCQDGTQYRLCTDYAVDYFGRYQVDVVPLTSVPLSN